MFFIKEMLLKISQNLQKNTCAWVSFLIKNADLRPATLVIQLNTDSDTVVFLWILRSF